MTNVQNSGGAPGSIQPTTVTPERTRAEAPPDDLIDLRGLLAGLWRGRWIITGCIVVALAAATAWIMTTQPTYYASAAVMVERDAEGIVDLRQTSDNRSLNASIIQSHIHFIRSSRLLGEVVDSLGLDEDPAFNSAAAEAPPPSLLARLEAAVRGLAGGLIGGADGGNGDAAESGGGPAAPANGHRLALETLKRRLNVRQVGVAYTIEVGATAGTPEKAARIANAVVDGYAKLRREVKVDSSTEAARLLAEQIADLEAQVRESADAVESFRTSSGVADEDRRQSLSRRLAELRESRAEARERIGRLEDRIGRMEAADSTESDPAGGAAGTPAALKNELTSLKARERSLDESVANTESRLSEIAGARSRLQQLERQASADRLIYERMLEEMKEISALENLQRADVRVIDRAMPPLHASGPSKKLALAGALGGGGALGLAILALSELLRRSFRTREELETATGLPVIGCLPRVRRIAKPTRVLDRLAKARAPELAEAMRDLYLGTLGLGTRRKGRVVMVSSACPGEGKSTAALLLAYTAMAFGSRSLIVDADARGSRLASILDLPERRGLERALSGETPAADAVQVTGRHGLHVLGPWRWETAPPDALESPAFGRMLDGLADLYDLVLVDTPPLGPVADGEIIARHADAVLMVVAWKSTRRAAVEDALRRLQRLDAQVVGTILSRVDLRREARYRGVPYARYRGYLFRPGRHRSALRPSERPRESANETQRTVA